MKYFITSDGKIHQVIDEIQFCETHPNAQDITLLPMVYKLYVKQKVNEIVSSQVIKVKKFNTNDKLFYIYFPNGETEIGELKE